MDGHLAPTRTPVQQFYSGQTVFVTGGSGFMGKVLIEKLLFACPELLAVHVLMRPKRGKAVETRLDDMFKLPLFQRIREECPHVLKKVIAVPGDITLDGLGLSPTSRQQLCERVTIVYHLAATLKLEAPLKDAIEMNLNGTRRVLDLCNELQHLRQMVHLSTAFCNCDQTVEMGEQVYDYPHRPEDLLRCTAWMEDGVLERITGDLLRPHVNAYTYSKRLAEILVRDQYPRLPVAIVRPSIVTPSWSEPIPGWVDSLNGPIGIMAGAAKGVIRTMLINGDNPSEIIPVDMAINGLITIPYDICRLAKAAPGNDSGAVAELPVFNVTCCESKKLKWKRVLELGESINAEYPIEAGVWYPGGSMTTSVAVHMMRAMLFHWLPAYVIDFLLFCFGQKRFMLRVQQKVSTGLEVLSFFTLRRWNFRSEKYSSIYDNLTAEDKVLFNMDMEPLDVAEYMKRSFLGGRQYCLKEPLNTLPKARRQMKALYVLDRLTKVFFVWLLLSYVLSWTDAGDWVSSLF